MPKNNELVSNVESGSLPELASSSENPVTSLEEAAELTIQEQVRLMENVRPHVSLKLAYQLEEKIAQERQAFERLLGIERKRTNHAEQYTYVLDPDYFEQKLL